MALTITENNKTFYLSGKLNEVTSDSLIMHIKYLMKVYDELTLNIDEVSEIDANGVRALKMLYKNALINNDIFHIVGYGCKEVYDELRHINAA
ncbi:hypothetical protein A9Q87_02890 [Flavobacteriales bacterium 34_180_T64]|nr:hypothetical protein A9Q87_02890 [Flavobacteriales bacterium 34_180_T64]